MTSLTKMEVSVAQSAVVTSLPMRAVKQDNNVILRFEQMIKKPFSFALQKDSSQKERSAHLAGLPQTVVVRV